MNAIPDTDMTLGQIAALRPSAIPVFERYGLDYCCGGKRSLEQACAVAGLAAARVLEAIAEEEARTPQPERSWADATMTELADHIEQTHHAFARDAIARLRVVVPRVVAAHGRNDPRLLEVAQVLEEFAQELHEHMVREERVLFPWLRRLERPTQIHTGPPWSVRRPISCMEHDHEKAGESLSKLRELTDGYTPPPLACMTYRSMLRTLEELERDTHVHIHKENAILFPAGIRAEEERLGKPPAPDGGGR